MEYLDNLSIPELLEVNELAKKMAKEEKKEIEKAKNA